MLKSIPTCKVTFDYGLLGLNGELLWGIVACYFRLLKAFQDGWPPCDPSMEAVWQSYPSPFLEHSGFHHQVWGCIPRKPVVYDLVLLGFSNGHFGAR